MRYCKLCLIPDTKPYIEFNSDGICNACVSHQKKNQYKESINWEARAQELERIILEAKSKKHELYDAVVPVSGGKDSITQVHTLLKHGMRVLAINIDYGIKTDIGIKNLNLIPKMGANLFIFRPEQKLHKKLIRLGLEDYGDPDLLSHCMLHAFPLRIALQLKVPLALLGENSAFEYGGEASIASKNRMTKAWFLKYAANSGITPRTISEKYNIDYSLLKQYDYPEELDSADIQPVFLSYFKKWDSLEHLKIAQSYGFSTSSDKHEGTYRNFVGIDEKINRLHQYIKVLKFGYGRATDHACEDLRNEYISREEAKKLVRENDLSPLGESYIQDICDYLDYTKDEFMAILDQYRNKNIWEKDSNGNWFIPNHLED